MIMILAYSGTNELIIGTDSYYTLATGNTITIKNQESKVEKEVYLSNSSNTRYISWDYTVVTGSTSEDLSNGIIFLQRGFHDITIFNDGIEIYTDNLFVNTTKPTIYEIGDDDEIIYSIPN